MKKSKRDFIIFGVIFVISLVIAFALNYCIKLSESDGDLLKNINYSILGGALLLLVEEFIYYKQQYTSITRNIRINYARAYLLIDNVCDTTDYNEFIEKKLQFNSYWVAIEGLNEEFAPLCINNNENKKYLKVINVVENIWGAFINPYNGTIKNIERKIKSSKMRYDVAIKSGNSSENVLNQAYLNEWANLEKELQKWQLETIKNFINELNNLHHDIEMVDRFLKLNYIHNNIESN